MSPTRLSVPSGGRRTDPPPGPAGLAARLAVAALVAALPAQFVHAAPAITEYALPSAGNEPVGIARGPDGNLWIAETQKISRITPAGVVTEYTVPTAGAVNYGIVAGPDGNLWFTEGYGNKIGRITPAGVITEFALPTPVALPAGIAVGADGNLWFAENASDKIGRITPAGTITEFDLPTTFKRSPFGVALGPDGNIWFTEQVGDRIGRITPAGAITEFPVPTVGGTPSDIAAGPDGNLWFSEVYGNRIGRITPAGLVTEFTLPQADSGPTGIAAGPDGNVWFAEGNGNRIARITPAGAVSEYPVPSPASQPTGLVLGPDGYLWFTEHQGDRVGRVTGVGTPRNPAPNDTAQVQCHDGSGAVVACSGSVADGRYGRDAAAAAGALVKTGAGVAGFDFTKIANDGSEPGAAAALGGNPGDWACTRDNATGLTWEMKTAGAADLRYGGHTYTWYSLNGTLNGGNPGDNSVTGTCGGTLATCDSAAYVAAVNAAALCGYGDWRLPTPNELLSIVDYSGASPVVDPAYFPNTAALFYWTQATAAANGAEGQVVSFWDGRSHAMAKSNGNRVRLVRGGQ